MIGFVTWPRLSNFLASADIRVFGCTWLFAMLLLALFYTLGVLFSISLLFVTNITTLWKHISRCYFEKLKPAIFLNYQYRVIHQYRLCILKLMQGLQVMATISLQCNGLFQIHSSVYFRLKIV